MSNEHVQVNIVVDSVGVTRAGFGLPLAASHTAEFAERVRLYTSAAGVSDDFDEDSPEQLWANAMFSQTPKPPKIAIGRMTGDVTQQYTVALSALGPFSSTAYTLKFSGTGFADQTVTITSDADATEDEILIALTAAINLVEDKTFTAAMIPSASAPAAIEITADVANAWFSVEVTNRKLLSIAQTHATPAGFSDDLTAILLENGDWYQLHTFFNSADYVEDTAEWVAANERTYVFDTCDTDVVTTAYDDETSTDVGAVLLGTNNSHVAGAFHPRPAAMFAGAWMGAWLPTEPGSATSKFISLEGPATVTLTATERGNLVARRMNSYERIYQIPITFEGMVFSTTYRFLDVRRDVDWLTDEVTKAVFGLLQGSPKIPYTPAGMAKIEGTVRGSVEGRAVAKGVLAEGSTRIEMPVFEDIDPSDKGDRVLRNVKFFGTHAGAIHSVIPINGTITF